MMNEQLLQQTLDLTIPNQRTFDTYICQTNQEAKNMLAFHINNPSESMILLKGAAATGKTHLLHAACHLYQLSGKKASFIPMKNPIDLEALLERPLTGELICIDNVDKAATHSDLEHLLFRTYNHAEMAGCKLIWSAQSTPNFVRKDLTSRQQSMLSIDLMPYRPDEILNIIEQYVALSQSLIAPEICELLTKRYTRNLSQLIGKIKEIEQYACAVHKKVTLKMAKELIFSDFHQLGE